MKSIFDLSRKTKLEVITHNVKKVKIDEPSQEKHTKFFLKW